MSLFFFFLAQKLVCPLNFKICVFLYSVDKYNYNLFCHFSPYIFSHCLSAWSFELMPLSLNSPFMFSSSFYSERFHQIHLQPFYSFFFFSFCYIFNASSHIFNFQWFFWFSGVLFHSHLFLFCRYKTLDLRILIRFFRILSILRALFLGFYVSLPLCNAYLLSADLGLHSCLWMKCSVDQHEEPRWVFSGKKSAPTHHLTSCLHQGSHGGWWRSQFLRAGTSLYPFPNSLPKV